MGVTKHGRNSTVSLCSSNNHLERQISHSQVHKPCRVHTHMAWMITAELQLIFSFDGGMEFSDPPTFVVVVLPVRACHTGSATQEGKGAVTSRWSHALCAASLHSWEVGCVISRFHSVNGCIAFTCPLKGQTAIQGLNFDLETNVAQTQGDWKDTSTTKEVRMLSTGGLP